MLKGDSFRLSMLGLPVLHSIEDLSKSMHVSKYMIYQLSSNSDKYYRTYTIPKKSGKPRLISQPSKSLKGFQSWVLVNILNKLSVSESCKGFEKDTSIGDNVKPHCNANTVLTLDLKDFFPSVGRRMVYNIFASLGYNKLVATILTNACTFRGGLPQGGPCSPKLANLATWRLDLRIQGYVGKRGISYTRYADDLTFSGLTPSKVAKIVPTIERIIVSESFQPNYEKTRIAGPGRAKRVTGLVISNSSYGIGHRKFKQVRSKIHHLTLPAEQSNLKLLKEVRGWLSYLNSVDRKHHAKALKYAQTMAEQNPGTLVEKILSK